MKIIPSFGAPRPVSTTIAALLAAAVVAGMLVAQLFSFESFPDVLMSLLGANKPQAPLTATLIVLGELFALPYLLSMYLSRLMRLVSAFCAFLVTGFWLVTSFTNAHALNSGLLADAVSVPGGLLAAIWSLVLFGLVCKVIFDDSRFRHATT